LRRVAVSIVAAILAAGAGGGLVVLPHAAPGDAAPNVDRRLTIVVPAGGGTVTSSPGRISCPPTCSDVFPAGTPVTLTAAPAAGFRVYEWSSFPECTTQSGKPNECLIDLFQDTTISAILRPAASLQVFANGGGAVTLSPPGIDVETGSSVSTCDSSVDDRGCSLAYLPGTRVTARAAPASGRTFAGWSAAGCKTRSCAWTAVAGETSLVASFDPLRLVVVIAGSGTVTSSPAGIACGGNRLKCAVDAPLGKTYVLDAGTGKHEWRFGCAPAGGDVHSRRCTATVAGFPTEVGVAFGGAGGPEPPQRITIRLDVTKNKKAKTASVHGRKIDCGSTCTATYKFGDMEQLTPVDAPGAAFVQWVNGCGSTRVCRFPVGPVTSMEAVFGPPFAARIVRLRLDSQRRVVARIRVNRPATVSLRLKRNGRRIAKTDTSVKAGETAVRAKLPRGVSGRFGVVAIVRSGAAHKRLVRSIRVRR
jgi:hypothetical protein